MTPTEPLQLHHSWPLCDSDQRFDLGRVQMPGDPATVGWRPEYASGRWSCDLPSNRLHWSAAVYAMFGFPASDVVPSRDIAVRHYDEPSRTAMERLRRHAIHHRRGFTLDIGITPVRGARRWLRLIAAPVVEDGRVVRLHGLKADVSHLYR